MTPLSIGVALVTVKADAPTGADVPDDIQITVVPNSSPVAAIASETVNTVEDVGVFVGDISGVFSDPDGDTKESIREQMELFRMFDDMRVDLTGAELVFEENRAIYGPIAILGPGVPGTGGVSLTSAAR